MDQKNHFVGTKSRVRFTAFMPPSDLRLSVFRIDGLAVADLWKLGQSIANEKKRNLYGVASLTVEAVQKEGLTVNPDDNPPRHAEVIGWSDQLDERLLVAKALAAEASLKLRG